MSGTDRRGALLFSTRLFLYFAVFSLPLIHPGIPVAYDKSGIILWFCVVPLEALIAFVPLRSLKIRGRLICAAAVLFIGCLAGAGLNPAALPGVGIGCLSFALSFLLFRFPRWGGIAISEQIFLALICFRMLGFSRSSEEVAADSAALTQGILIFTIAVFLLHGMVIYYCLYRRRAEASAKTGKKRREFAVFATGAAAALLLLIVFLPSDFVKNSVISNLLEDRINPPPVPLDEEGEGMPNGNLRSRRGDRRMFPQGNRGQGNQGDGDGPRLQGIPESRWPGDSDRGEMDGDDGDMDGDGGGDRGNENGRRGAGGNQAQRQYAVMVVAAKRSPVYAAGAYLGDLHPLRGFRPSKDEILNSLPTMRLLETWLDSSPGYERDYEYGRSSLEVFSLSTLPEKYLPYRPKAVEPTVLQRGYGPFRYSHSVISDISISGPRDWQDCRQPSAEEEVQYAEFLDVALAKNDLVFFEAHLRGALEAAQNDENNPGGYFGKILAILKSFEMFQYNAGYTDNTSIPALVDFLTDTKEGDCTEFSNTSAVLGRLAGIPSRVVTGFLAAEELQTPAHLRGLSVLRSQIKVLQDFPFEDLFLVTTAHRHSWVQFWLPEYGWIDFESTSFAMPPIGFGDANNRDVIIPIFEKEQEITPLRSFPWRPVLRALGILAAAAVLALYVLRYGRELILLGRARRFGTKAARALFALLLMRLAAEGKPIRAPSQTSVEYAGLFPQDASFAAFASLYTEIRYRNIQDPAEQGKLLAVLWENYRNILRAQRRPGPHGFFKRIFSLRGLSYL
ncbi:MAG: transglutaminase domain-containing protein [Spirochaetales bacterium]|jgi:hypothetical protein|nr:transglutaminase domain-containing protein [Spirochaetales bacterium]